jgi:rod shape-determining protein MreB and related proteins
VTFLSGLRRVSAGPDLAIDLGTANTRLYADGHGLIADEPSIIMVRPDTGVVEAVGAGARYHLYSGKRRLVAPLRSGVIADVDAASALLGPLFKRARRFGLAKPRVLACTPTDARTEERAALIEAASRAGAGHVVLAPEPLAAAIGAGMDVALDYAQMIVDVGDGVTDIAVIRSGELITTSAIRTAYGDLKRSVEDVVAQSCGIALNQHDAERLIREVGIGHRVTSAIPLAVPAPHVAAGNDLRTGIMRRARVSRKDLTAAMDAVLNEIVGFVVMTVRSLSSEISCEVIESGIRLTGGGALLEGLADVLSAETGIEVRRARDPLHAVINGARQMLRTGLETGLWQH